MYFQRHESFIEVMRTIYLPIMFFLVVLIGIAASYADDIISNPDAQTVLFLQYQYSHTIPPYESLAKSDRIVQSSDKFHDQEALKRAEEILKTRASNLMGVKKIIINLDNNLSKYDPQNQEYNFDLNDGTYIPFFNVYGRQVNIALTNGNRASPWILSSKVAEEVLRKNMGQRDVTLSLILELIESTPGADGESLVLNAKIVGYDILSGGYGRKIKLGHVVVESEGGTRK